MRPENTHVLRKGIRDQLRSGRRSAHSRTHRQRSRDDRRAFEGAVASVLHTQRGVST